MASQRPYESEYKRSPGEDARLEVDMNRDLRCSCGNREFQITVCAPGITALVNEVMCIQCGTYYGRRAMERARS